MGPNSAKEHYEKLLARHYTWMRGDFDSNVDRYLQLLREVGSTPQQSGKALDLGAGSGLQTIALTKLGYQVLSLDSSETLLDELRERAAGSDSAILTVLGDMREAKRYAANGPFETVVCMGDTLAHLDSFAELSALISDVRDVLESGGRLVLEFRDYTVELRGVDRAIPVRLDEAEIMTTFLEYEPEHVNVHDMILLKEADGWSTKKSAYKKLRLGPAKVVETLKGAGFEVIESREDHGFYVIVGRV